MVTVGDEGYWLVRLLLQRGLALLYLVAFLVAVRQFRPLAGEAGIRPLDAYVDRWSFRERPSLLHRFPDDRVVAAAAWAGVGLSGLALLGAPSWLPRGLILPGSVALWGTLWALYLSFVNAGGVFYGYGWESMLLETGFLAIFLGAGPFAAPAVVVWLLRWVLFRNMFGAGLIKLRGDTCWRELTCLDHHYETQPLPNPGSWFAHHLPDRFHRVEVLGNHVVELAVPFLYFAPQPVAAAAGVATIGFQGWLMLTGNFSWLNALTIVLATSTFADGVLAAGLPIAAPSTVALPLWFQAAVLGMAALVLALSVRPTRNMLSRTQVMNTAFDPLHLVNTYGAFGSITKTRHELVVEGTDAPAPSSEDDWEPYRFHGKPTDPSRRPPQVAPYHHRLDWQLWFAAMSPSPRRSPWVYRFVEALLRGDESVSRLLREDPFVEDPPTYVRLRRWRYRFTTPAERDDTGDWWHRDPVGTYLGPVDLEGLEGSGRASGRPLTDGGEPGGPPPERRRADGRGPTDPEGWVRLVVAGGLGLLAGLWLIELGLGPWLLGPAMAAAGTVALLWGIWSQVEVSLLD